MLGWLGALWGLTGVSLLLASAIVRLAPVALETLRQGLSPGQWLAWGGWMASMLYFEGYRGFQKAFSPRVAARARHLRDHPALTHGLLAPLFCMAFFHAPRRRIIASVCLTTGIILLVVLVRRLGQPWRGIVDAGVVAGLAWGLASLLFYGAQALASKEFRHSPEVP